MNSSVEPTLAVSQELQYRVTQHYYLEARLLQNHEYRQWLETLVAEDIHYWMPVYEQRYIKDKRPAPTPDDMAIYNDDYSEVKMRVERLYTGTVWMEDPPSRIRYLITNIEPFHTEVENELKVYSNFLIIRNRGNGEKTEHAGGREDILRDLGNGFQLARRKINLDARVVMDKNLYFFA